MLVIEYYGLGLGLGEHSRAGQVSNPFSNKTAHLLGCRDYAWLPDKLPTSWEPVTLDPSETGRLQRIALNLGLRAGRYKGFNII